VDLRIRRANCASSARHELSETSWRSPLEQHEEIGPAARKTANELPPARDTDDVDLEKIIAQLREE
jgi:hypothetical protein